MIYSRFYHHLGLVLFNDEVIQWQFTQGMCSRELYFRVNYLLLCNCYFAVSGEANFEMKLTGLTLGGFIQPSIARNLLEQPTNVEKGLCQRFMWFVAKPTAVPFDDLEKVNRDFSASIGMHIYNVQARID